MYRQQFITLGIVILLSAAGCRGPIAGVMTGGHAAVGGVAAAQPVAPAMPTGMPPTERMASTIPQTAPPPVSQASFSPPTTSLQTSSPLATKATGNPLPEPTREEAFAVILEDLQQLGATHPEAQQRLLEQLQTAQPAHWPLLMKRMKADLAYHDQLKQDSTSRSKTMPASHYHDAQLNKVQSHDRNTNDVWQSPEPAEYEAPAPPRLRNHSHQQQSHQQSSDTEVLPPVTGGDSEVRLASAQMPLRIENPHTMNHAAGDDWQVELQQAIAALRANTPPDAQSVDEAYQHLRMRLMQLAGGDLDGAVSPVPGLSSAEQDYWSKQLFAVSTLLDASTQPELKRRAAAAAMHQAAATAQLEQLASLTVRNLTFCQQIYGYGAFEAAKDRTFRPGEELALYAEVENFRSNSTDQGYHTALGTSYRILDNNGNRVDGNDFPMVEDFCLSRRRDYFMQYILTLPTTLKPGEYQLELSISDQLGQKIGKTSIDFEIK